MNLAGYLKPLGEHTFSIPIYKNESGYYCHLLSEDFKVLDFSSYDINEDLLEKLPKKSTYKKHYEKGEEGPVVFFARNGCVIIEEFHKAIVKILKVLDGTEHLNKYIYEELAYYSAFLSDSCKHAKEDSSYYLRRFYLKKYIYENFPDILNDVVLVMRLIDDYICKYKVMRRRNSLSSYYKENNKKVIPKNGVSNSDFIIETIEAYKSCFVKEFLDGRTGKAFSILGELLEYQFPISRQKLIIKTLCALSKNIQSYGYTEEARILLYLSEQFYVSDAVIGSQFAEILKAEGNYEGAKAKYKEIEQEFPKAVVAKNGYADVLRLEGDYEGARDKYKEIQKEFSFDLYSKHAILVLNMIMNNAINEKEFIVKENPKSLQDNYFYHAYVMYFIRKHLYVKAERMILGVINKVPFYRAKKMYEQTYLYLKVLLGQIGEALENIDSSSYEDEGCPASNVIKAEIYFLNGLENEAIRYLDLLKKYPENSVAYSLSMLITEKYLTKNLSSDLHRKEELDRILADEEFKLLGICA